MIIKRLITISCLGVIVCTIFFLSGAFIEPSHATGNGYKVKNIQDTIPETDTADGKIFAKVETEASYPGGEKAWLNYLIQNVNGNIAAKKKAPVGKYTVVIQFVIDKDGYVSDISPLTNHGFGMEEEVISVLKKSPRWKAAIQDGRKVRAYRKQPVTFQVAEEKKKNPLKD